MKRLFMVEPVNMIIGVVALFGVISFFINQPTYGLILLIISTLIESITRITQ